MNNLTANSFFFEAHKLRVVDENGEPWFVAKDVCDILGISNVTQAVGRLDDDERSMFKIGRQGYTNIINESGLFALILQSRKAEAKRLRKWVTSEVLPSIRKTGRYTAHALPPHLQIMQSMIDTMADQDRRLNDVENSLAKFDPNTGYMTILGYCNTRGIKIPRYKSAQIGKQAKKLCVERGLEPDKAYDERYGKVGSYPVEILEELIGDSA